MSQLKALVELGTLGETYDSPITQIAACIFNYNKIIDSFFCHVDFEDACERDLIHPEIQQLWEDTDDEMRQQVLPKGAVKIPLDRALENLSTLCFIYDIKEYWGYSTIDFPILFFTYEMMEMAPPMDYNECFDIKTIQALNPHLPLPFRSTPKDALEDAQFHTTHLIDMMNERD